VADKLADRRSSRLEAQAKLDLRSLAGARQTRPHDAQKGFDPLGVYSDTKLCNLLHMRSLAGALALGGQPSSSGEADGGDGGGRATVTVSAVRGACPLVLRTCPHVAAVIVAVGGSQTADTWPQSPPFYVPTCSLVLRPLSCTQLKVPWPMMSCGGGCLRLLSLQVTPGMVNTGLFRPFPSWCETPRLDPGRY
jgi:hypothetical protein